MEPGAVQSGTWLGMITTRGIGADSALLALLDPDALLDFGECLETVWLLAHFE